MTDELGLPAEAWRVEPNTSWQQYWLAIQDGPLSRGMGVGCSKSLSFQTSVSSAKVRVNEAIATLPWATAPDRAILPCSRWTWKDMVSIKGGKRNINKQGLPVKKSSGNPETSQTGMVSVSNSLGYDTTRVHLVDWLVIANMSCHK